MPEFLILEYGLHDGDQGVQKMFRETRPDLGTRMPLRGALLGAARPLGS